MPPRQMRLTEALVARVPPHSGESGRLAGRSDLPTEAEYAAAVAALLAEAPSSGDVWVFAYGSLIWLPGFDQSRSGSARCTAGGDRSASAGSASTAARRSGRG